MRKTANYQLWPDQPVPFSQFVEGRVDTAQPHRMKVLRSSSLWYSLNDVTVTQELADVDWQATFVITAQHSFHDVVQGMIHVLLNVRF